MSLIRLTDVTRYYGAEHIVGPVRLAIHPGDRIGLIGPNGSGKTSLLRMMAGSKPDAGEVFRRKSLKVSYLRQEQNDELLTMTLYDFGMSAFDALREEERRLRALEAQMADDEVQRDPERLQTFMDDYARRLQAFESAGGYDQKPRCRAALFGLGFSEKDLHRPLTSLSGGERARAQLAYLLLRPADVLLLDEPTNHLDLTSTEWLQSFLSRDSRAYVLVSHDRLLLDALVTTVWEIESKSVYVYSGNYTASRSQAALRRERALKQRAFDEKERERLEAFVRKWRAGTRAAQAKSRARRLEKAGPSEPEPTEASQVRWKIPVGSRSERRVCTLDDVTIGYATPLLKNVNLEVTRGQRIGIVGANGSGKSTLLQTIAGALKPKAGLVDTGRGVEIAHFSQHRTDLDPDGTVLDEALAGLTRFIPEARSVLARFLFRGDDVFKTVKTLSGGEKSRLALAKVLVQGGNLLLLDEPTNHLDIAMVEALEEALIDYEGTIMFITHDRALLQTLAQTIWLIEDGEVRVFDDGYDGLQQWTNERFEAARTKKERVEEDAPASAASSARSRHRRKSPFRYRQTKQRLEDVEKTIERLQRQREELEATLADPTTYDDGEQARRLTFNHERLAASLAEYETKWERLVDELDALEPD